MARSASITLENNFTRGLITEFTALNFPENAVTDCNNVEFSELGRVNRRLGIDAEDDFTTTPISTLTTVDGAKVEYKWTSVGGDGTKTFVAQQIGSFIRFFEQKSGSALSSNLMPFTIALASYTAGAPASTIAQYPVQFAQGKGYLFIAHPKCNPIYVEYNVGDPGSITVKSITVKVRDFERLDDGLDIQSRPATLSALHKYNLYNQGWYYSALIYGQGNSPKNVLDGWAYIRSDYPANADIWWMYKNAQEVAYFNANNIDNLSANVVMTNPSKITLGNTPAPSGHYIYTAWNINRTGLTGIPTLPTISSGTERPSCIAFFAGRVFYAGVGADKYGDKIYYSQIIEGEDQFGKCYQVNDPTSETVYDLVDSDGGVLSIAQTAKVIGLQAVGDALIVLSTNGCFAIRGSDNGSFKATDYTVEFISEIGAVTQSSVTLVDGQLIWVNYDAMYAMTKDQIGISFVVQNLSKPTIQKVIDSIPPKHKPYVKAAYNKKERLVQFLYSDIEAADIYTYNKILQLNVVSNSFTIFTLPTFGGPQVVGILSIDGSQKIDEFDEVIRLNGDSVVTSTFDEVVVEATTAVPSTEIFKYALYWPSGVQQFTYGELKDTFYRDFRSYDNIGTSYVSQFLSGYRIRGETLRKFNATPIAVTLENYPIASQPRCTIQGLWDYDFRRTSIQELYITRPEPDYLLRRIKLRGKGKSLQLLFSSVDDHPFSVIGWATFDSGGSLP